MKLRTWAFRLRVDHLKEYSDIVHQSGQSVSAALRLHIAKTIQRHNRLQRERREAAANA